MPVSCRRRKGEPLVIDTDEPPRRDTSLEQLARLPTVYPDGICTAGNSSSENDGAAAVVLMSEGKAQSSGSGAACLSEVFAVAAADPTLTYPAVPASVHQSACKGRPDH